MVVNVWRAERWYATNWTCKDDVGPYETGDELEPLRVLLVEMKTTSSSLDW